MTGAVLFGEPTEPKPSSARRSRMRVAASMCSLFVLATAVAGCKDAASDAGSDCVSPFRHEGSEYLPATGPRVAPEAIGQPLGEGAFESCAQYEVDGGSDELGEPRPVYGLPGVPATQAVVLAGPDGRGRVFLVTDEPADGWDLDVQPGLKDTPWLDDTPTR